MLKEQIAQNIFQWLRGDALFNDEAWNNKLDNKGRERLLKEADSILNLFRTEVKGIDIPEQARQAILERLK